MTDEIGQAWKYGDPESFDLKHALAKKHNVAFENIIVGEGIDGLLGYLVRLFVEQGDNVVTTDGAYPTFNYHVEGFGGQLHKVPFKDDTEDLDNLLNKVIETKAKMLYISNPNNPMGTINSLLWVIQETFGVPLMVLLESVAPPPPVLDGVDNSPDTPSSDLSDEDSYSPATPPRHSES